MKDESVVNSIFHATQLGEGCLYDWMRVCHRWRGAMGTEALGRFGGGDLRMRGRKQQIVA